MLFLIIMVTSQNTLKSSIYMQSRDTKLNNSVVITPRSSKCDMGFIFIELDLSANYSLTPAIIKIPMNNQIMYHKFLHVTSLKELCSKF